MEWADLSSVWGCAADGVDSKTGTIVRPDYLIFAGRLELVCIFIVFRRKIVRVRGRPRNRPLTARAASDLGGYAAARCSRARFQFQGRRSSMCLAR